MPLAYPQGTLAEHRACRQDSVAFDVSHLGTVRVEGPTPSTDCRPPSSNDLRRVGPGRAQYTHLLDDADGSVVDDIIVWWLVDERLRRHAQRLQHRPGGREPSAGEDTTAARAVIAVQGPHARTRLATVAPEAAAVPRFGVAPFVWEGVRLRWRPAPATPARTASSGRAGRRRRSHCGPRSSAAGIHPAGLGARDTLRLEAACRCTVTSSARASPRCRPAWAGWSDGTRPTFRGRRALEAEAARRRAPPPGRAGHRGSPASARGWQGRGRRCGRWAR